MCASTVSDYQKIPGNWLESAYTIIEPIVFSHPLKFSERLRGSSLLQASSKGEVENYAFFIMCDVFCQWGLADSPNSCRL